MLGALSRSGALCAEAGQGTAVLARHPHPRLWPPTSASLWTQSISVDEAEHLPHNQLASVATLRGCSGSSRNAVRHPSRTGVQLRRNPQLPLASPASLL